MNEAGALGFRDFPCLPVTKENRFGSHRTLPFQWLNWRITSNSGPG